MEVITWRDAESLLPLTSPTAAKHLKQIKLMILPGQHLVVAIGKNGNTYSIVKVTKVKNQMTAEDGQHRHGQ